MTWTDTETMQEVAAWYEQAAEPTDHLLDEREVWEPAHCHHDATRVEDADPERRYPAVEVCEDCGFAWRVSAHRAHAVC